MRKYIYIGIGGFFGAILRYLIRAMQIENYNGQFPINTLVINLTGCFLLAVILTLALEVLEISSCLRLGISTGFIGAFTTFSTLCKEISTLAFQEYYLTAFAYALISIGAGLAFSYLGYCLAWRIISRQRVKTNQIPGEKVRDGSGES